MVQRDQMGEPEKQPVTSLMKICYFADGGSIHTQRWIEYFSGRGHEIFLFTLRPYTGSDTRIKIYALDRIDKRLVLPKVPRISGLERYIRRIDYIRKILAEIQPDVVHGHQISLFGHYAYLSGWHPLIMTAWGSDVFLIKQNRIHNQWLTRQALRNADFITVDSLDLMKAVRKISGEDTNIRTIYFGVNTDLFKPCTDRDSIKAQYGFSPDDRVIFSPRNITPIYNIENIVRAFAAICALKPDVNIKLLLKSYVENTEYKEYKEYKEKVLRLIAEKKLEKRISIIGEVPYPEMARLYNLADVVISVSLSDSGPVSVLEAMSCGRTILASDLPSLQEWITSGENGFLADPNDLSEITEQLQKALELPDSVKQAWGQKNRDIICEKADHYKNMEKMEALYQSTIDGKNI